MLFLTYVFLLIIFVIVAVVFYKALILFFKYREKVQNKEHYPIVFGMMLASVPIIAKFSSVDTLLISFINKYTKLSLPIPRSEPLELLFYLVFVSLIAFLGYLSLRTIVEKNNKTEKKSNSKKIEFPEETPVISPHLYIRIKELFELKYEKNNLKLSYDQKEKVLYGAYSEQFHNYQFFIYTSDDKNVSADDQNTILEKLKNLNNKVFKGNSEFENLYFYFISDGNFESHANSELKCFTENDFLDNIIDFKNYLNKNIEIFDSKENDIGEKPLKDTFILPTYNNGKTDLVDHLDNWLNEKSYKHISLLADYGMGKTSFLRYYTKYLSEKILEGKKFTRYPVFISLTNTSPMSNDGIGTKIESFVARELGVNYALFERLVHMGKIVFILDGFDEMGFIGTESTRFDQFNSIWKLATKNNKLIISGRPSYLPTSFERSNLLNTIDKELYDTQVTPFSEVLQLDYFDAKKIFQTVNVYYNKSDSKKYIKYIKQNKSIFDLCKRPSMLHMTMHILPSIYQNNSSEEITSSLIMTKYIEYWISRQDSKNIFGIFKQSDDKKKQFIMHFFIDLSYYMFNYKTLVIEKYDLDKLINVKIKNAKLDIEQDKHRYEGFVNEVYTGYFIEIDITNENHFKFVHKSIFEFFVSRKIIEIINKNDFSNEIFTQDWGMEISDFVRDSINVKNDSKYPSLIRLRNSFFDKTFFIPITKLISMKRIVYFLSFSYIFLNIFYLYINKNIVEEKNRVIYMIYFFISFMILDVMTRKRLKFISRAYYMDFISGNNKMSNNQFQCFMDFTNYFKEISNKYIQNLYFKNVNIRNMMMNSVELHDITFENCRLGIKLNNSLLDNINIINSRIRHLKFENATLNNISFDQCSFHKLNIFDYMMAKTLHDYYKINLYVLKFILKEIKVSSYRDFLRIRRSRIILIDVTIDEQSVKSFQKFIKENGIEKKDIVCNDMVLKNKLFDLDCES